MVRFASLALAAILLGSSGLRADPPRKDGDGNPLPAGVLFRLGSMRLRHGDGISNSALSPDGKLLATSSRCAVVVWELASDKIRHRFSIDNDSPFSRPGIAFPPDGSRLVHINSPKLGFVWDMTTGKELRRFKNEKRAPLWTHCRFFPDGSTIIVGRGDATVFMEVATGKEIRKLPWGNIWILSPDTKICLGVWSNAIGLGETATGKGLLKLEVEVNGLTGVAFAPDGKALAVVAGDRKANMRSLLREGKKLAKVDEKIEVQVRALPGGNVLAAFPLPASARRERDRPMYYVGFLADGKTLWLATGGGLIHRWDLVNKKELPPLARHPGGATNVHALPRGATLVSTGADGLIRRWDAATGKELAAPVANVGQTCAALSPTGRWVAVGDEGGRLELWDSNNGKRLHTLQMAGPAVMQVAFKPNGKEVAAVLESGEVRFWEILSGKPGQILVFEKDTFQGALKRLFGMPTSRRWYTLVFSPNGQSIYIGTNQYRMKKWDLTSDKPGWDKAVGHVVLMPDGKSLVEAEVFGKQAIINLNVDTGQERFRTTLLTNGMDNRGSTQALAFAPDGVRLAVAWHTGWVTLFDGITGKEQRRILAGDEVKGGEVFSDRPAERASVDALAFSSDGLWLATGGCDTSVRIWEVESGQEVLRLKGHEGNVKSVAFGAAGRTLLSCGQDGQVLVWSLRPTATKATLERRRAELGAKEAKTTYQTVWALSDDPRAAAFLRTKLAPVMPLPSEQIKQWITS